MKLCKVVAIFDELKLQTVEQALLRQPQPQFPSRCPGAGRANR